MHSDEMCTRVDFFIDKVRAPRFTITRHKIPALNVAMRDFINDRYDNIKDQQGKISFEAVERVRDELYPLITETNLVFAQNIGTQPDDYMYEIGMRVNIDGTLYRSRQITYNELDDVELATNKFTMPDKSEDGVYHLKTSRGFRVIYGIGATGLTVMHLRYLKQPPEIIRSEIPILAGPNLTIGQLYLVIGTNSITHNAVVYTPGQYFVAVNTTFVGGTVVLIVDCLLPDNTHDEICKRAANILMSTVDDYNKAGAMKAQERTS